MRVIDLAVVNSLQIDVGDAEVRVTELALYDVEWHALAPVEEIVAMSLRLAIRLNDRQNKCEM